MSGPEERRRYQLSGKAKDKILRVLNRELRKIEGIRMAFVHGSFTEDVLPFGDVDLAVLFADSTSASQRLNACLNLAVRLSDTTGYPVDVHSLNDSTPAFAFHASQGRPIGYVDMEDVYEYIERTCIEYMELKPFLDANFRELMEVRGIAGRE